MKKVGLLILLILMSFPCAQQSVCAKNSAGANLKSPAIPENAKISKNSKTEKMIFEYHIPDEENISPEGQSEQEQDITSDDITADTSGIPSYEEEDNEEDDSYNISDMYSDILYGFAEYNEDEQDGIELDSSNVNLAQLNITQPYKIEKKNYTALKSDNSSLMKNIYSKYSGAEYNIASKSNTNYKSFGGFSAGTIYNQGIDYGEFEQSSGLFSRYETGRFAVSTAYLKTVNSTNNNYNDNFYFAPEIRLNSYLTLKEILSADTVKKTKKAEFVVSFNPFGIKDKDRLRFDLGASQTYDDTNSLLKSQFKFSTNFKL